MRGVVGAPGAYKRHYDREAVITLERRGYVAVVWGGNETVARRGPLYPRLLPSRFVSRAARRGAEPVRGEAGF